jgi:cell division transport system ATP-binding protein
MIRFTKVSKEYQRSGAALTSVSFSVSKGEFLFLTGPSGAGKSTILKLIYMEERPSDGEVRVAGLSSVTIRQRDIPGLRRRLGIVFQDFRLLEDRTAEANVAFALEVTGAPRSSIGPKVSRALAQVGLASKGTSYPRELSGGEQQRVAIARALVNDPLLLVADEPTGNLDEDTRDEIIGLLEKLWRDNGLTMVMVTHDSSIARRAQRLGTMRDGQLTVKQTVK